MPTLDRKKPHLVKVDFKRQTRVVIQDGNTYTESGNPIVDETREDWKFNCPRCEYGCGDKMAMFHHLTDIHKSPQNIIERERKLMDKIEPPVVEEEVQDPNVHACKHCPSKFKTQQALASHQKKHKPKKA